MNRMLQQFLSSSGWNSLRPTFTLLITLVCFSEKQLQGQQVPPTLLQQVLQAFSPTGKLPNKLVLSGTAEWLAGSTDEHGTVQLISATDGSASEAWTLSTQSHSSTQSALQGNRACSYTDSHSQQHNVADLSCMWAVPWFSPWFATASVANATLGTLSADTAAGLERINYLPNLTVDNSSTSSNDLLVAQRGTTVSVLYNALSGLPAALEYQEARDSEPAHDLLFRVVFSDYSPESGFIVPHHIQRYVQRTLQSDIHITSVTAE